MTVFTDMLANGTPRPNSGESYREYLTRLAVLDNEFRFGEIVDRTEGDKKEPPLKLWHRMALTLAAVQDLRDSWGRAIHVIAAYRPGDVGAENSQHKHNAALDIDVYSGDLREWYALAVAFWCEYGIVSKMGLGLYTGSRKSLAGNRVHIDTGYRCRTWQGVYRGGFQKPWMVAGKPAQLSIKIAHERGYDVPTRDDI
jgi:hypothetical protein